MSSDLLAAIKPLDRRSVWKMGLIRRPGPWRSHEQIEPATAEWVDWGNQRRLHSAAGDMLPAAFEEPYYRHREAIGVA